MSNISIKVNLANLKCAIKSFKGKSGAFQDCLVIPIETNKLIRGKEGIYLDLVAFPLKEIKDNSRDTHCIKQSFDKEYLAGLPEGDKMALPFLGSLVDWDKSVKVNSDPEISDIKPDLQISEDLPF
jgi:hypothetical protein